MFDRPPATPADARTAREDIDRLCALYDRLVASGEALSPEAATDLRAMAGIYDLEVEGAPAEVWAALRAVLTREAPRAAATVGPVPSFEPLTLMLVEDDTETAADLTATLSEAGHRVIGPFRHAEAAEGAAAHQAIDLALLDINLAGPTDGVALAATLKARWGVPAMFLSGDVGTAARHADAAEALLLKPYGGRDVLDAMSRWTAARR